MTNLNRLRTRGVKFCTLLPDYSTWIFLFRNPLELRLPKSPDAKPLERPVNATFVIPGKILKRQKDEKKKKRQNIRFPAYYYLIIIVMTTTYFRYCYYYYHYRDGE